MREGKGTEPCYAACQLRWPKPSTTIKHPRHNAPPHESHTNYRMDAINRIKLTSHRRNPPACLTGKRTKEGGMPVHGAPRIGGVPAHEAGQPKSVQVHNAPSMWKQGCPLGEQGSLRQHKQPKPLAGRL